MTSSPAPHNPGEDEGHRRVRQSLTNFSARALRRFGGTGLSRLALLDPAEFVDHCLSITAQMRHPLLPDGQPVPPLVEDYFLSAKAPRKPPRGRESQIAASALSPANPDGRQTTPPQPRQRSRAETVRHSGLINRLFEASAPTIHPRRRIIVGLIHTVETSLTADERLRIENRLNHYCREAFRKLKASHIATKSAEQYRTDAVTKARLYERKWRRPDRVSLPAFLIGGIQSAISNDLRSGSVIVGGKPAPQTTGNKTTRVARHVELTENIANTATDTRQADAEADRERYQEAKKALIGFIGDKPELVAIINALEHTSLREGRDGAAQWNHKELAEVTGLRIERVRKLIEQLDRKLVEFRDQDSQET
jgi:hypothetical protein